MLNALLREAGGNPRLPPLWKATMNNISINFIDGTPMTLTPVRQEGTVTVYRWSHISFHHIEVVSPKARVEFEVEGDRFRRATYYCENPLCGQPEHDFTLKITLMLRQAGAEMTLANAVQAFTASWVAMNARIFQAAGLFGD